MKNGSPCPKCDGKKIVYIPGGLMEDQNHAAVGGLLSWVRFRIARYVCTTCGYTEEWVDRPDDLEKVRSLARKR